MNIFHIGIVLSFVHLLVTTLGGLMTYHLDSSSLSNAIKMVTNLNAYTEGVNLTVSLNC